MGATAGSGAASIAASLIPGLAEALVGMRRGGKRRVLVPPEQGYAAAAASTGNGGGAAGGSLSCGQWEPQPPTFATQRQLQNHCTEPLLFEVEMLRITP